MKPQLLSIALSLACIADLRAQETPAPAPAAAPSMTAAECEVWNRERSFAKSVEEHDAGAFAEHLHPGTVFIAGGGALLRGPDAVAADWAAIVAGKEIVLRWHPRHVVIGGDPDIAHSRGPYWMENPDPKAPQRYLTGQFVSIWTRVDGEWKILFDGGGGGRPEPATAEQVEALQASLPKECPQS